MKYRYQLFFPVGGRMLDYAMKEQSKDLQYECVYTGEIDVEFGKPIPLDKLWRRHNLGDNLDGDRPRAREIRSMCVGDIVFLHGFDQAYLCEVAGWKEIYGEDMANIGSESAPLEV